MSRVSQIAHALLRPVPFVPDIPTLAECVECRYLIEHEAGSWHIAHLIHEHSLSESEAHSTVEWIAVRVRDFTRILPADTFVRPRLIQHYKF
jgi:hypothetical protein